MTLSTTLIGNPVGSKLIQETAATNAIEANVTGASGALFMIDIDNTNAGAVYLKLFDNAAPVLGTTAPDFVLRISANTRRSVAIPLGFAFNALSFAVVTGAAEASVAAPVSGVAVRLVTT